MMSTPFIYKLIFIRSGVCVCVRPEESLKKKRCDIKNTEGEMMKRKNWSQESKKSLWGAEKKKMWAHVWSWIYEKEKPQIDRGHEWVYSCLLMALILQLQPEESLQYHHSHVRIFDLETLWPFKGLFCHCAPRTWWICGCHFGCEYVSKTVQLTDSLWEVWRHMVS